MEGDHGIFDRDGTLFAELAEGASDGFACRACHGSHLFVGEKQRESIPAVYMLSDLVSKLEEEAAEAASHGLGEGDAASVLKCEAIFLADALNGAHLSFAMIAKEGEESFAFDGTELCRGE